MTLRRRFIFISVFLVWPSNLVAAVSQSTTRVVQKSITVSDRERIAADNDRDISMLSLLPSSNFYRRGGDIQEVSDEKYKISLSPLAFTSIFGFLGGWSHALCNKQFDVYTAMVTGHILNLSIFLAEKNWKEALSRISIIGSYFGGVASARSLELKCERGRVEGTSNNHHFKIIAPLVVVIFSIVDMSKLEKVKIALLPFGFGLVYPSVSAALGGTITHLMTGHTTNVARLVGAKQMRHRGMKTSVCVIGSVITGGFFGTKVLGLLGDEFPYFTVLGFLYAAALLLL